MGGYVAKGWGILYFVPRASSAYLDVLLRAERELGRLPQRRNLQRRV